ncbi:agamous-like MADS-box protein AGL18 [Raphanus sativus]|uniref:Agamous-like MADS-box protein AGL18 n=1 Tax=Raphanus sativus TaxID=3726 RepID=A0A9W3DJC5_RAPSA|nr:agamous-like MADS-box protein AGL18 [Raphanus sativus]XP_056863716.1 agamous-like MADS-box protein AGL18 [Raphanus sativus]
MSTSPFPSSQIYKYERIESRTDTVMLRMNNNFYFVLLKIMVRTDESLRSELERLRLAVERLKGKELEGMSFWELISLEKRLNDSLHSVKKVGRSRL